MKTTNRHIINFNGHARLAMVCALCLFAVYAGNAQPVVDAYLKADSNHILIGDHLNLKLRLKYPKGTPVFFPHVKDSVGQMELVSASKIDTASNGGNTILTQNLVVSAYDSGVFSAGPVTVLLKKPDGTFDTVLSNNVPVAVATIAVDTTKAFKDIKAPLKIPYSLGEFIYYLIALVVILLIIAGVVVQSLYYKGKKQVKVARPKPKEPAHVWAKRELKKLEEEKLWQNGDVKTYYSKLTEVVRLYLEYRFNWMALESTTEEISAEIKDYEINDVAKNLLLQTLGSADLVKFAKMEPAPEANEKAIETARNFIDITAQAEEKPDEKK